MTRTALVGAKLQSAVQGKAVEWPDVTFRLYAILLALIPALIWIAPPLGSTPPGLALFRFGSGLAGGLILGLLWFKSPIKDPVRTVVAFSKTPCVALFGHYEDDREMDGLSDCLKDRRARRLWRKFRTITVDVQEQPALCDKYDVDPERGMQAMFFLRDGTRIAFDGRDRIFADDIMDPRRLENHLQSVLSQWEMALARPAKERRS